MSSNVRLQRSVDHRRKRRSAQRPKKKMARRDRTPNVTIVTHPNVQISKRHTRRTRGTLLAHLARSNISSLKEDYLVVFPLLLLIDAEELVLR